MEKENIFFRRKTKTQKEKKENMWRRKAYFLWGRKTRKIKKREIFGEGKYMLFPEEKKKEANS